MNKLTALLIEDGGQDLIEYALLASFIGFAAVAAVDLLTSSMSDLYEAGLKKTDGLAEIPPSP